MAAIDYPEQVQEFIDRAILDIGTKMRAAGIPDDWKVDLKMEADPHNSNSVRIVATAHPPTGWGIGPYGHEDD